MEMKHPDIRSSGLGKEEVRQGGWFMREHERLLLQ